VPSNSLFAFLLHGFHFLSDEGIMAIILPHGVLFRGGAEERIRTKLLKGNNIDTVIGLPSNLFFSTGIPVCILVLKKCKKFDDILFLYHFPDIRKTIAMPKGAEKEIDGILLTRYVCYLIAQNGDSRKQEIAFAQNYFAVQTRKAELVEQRLLEYERVKAWEKFSQTEKQLSGILYEKGVDNQDFAIIRNKGDQVLFRLNTQILKRKY
jgi:hypothetical protein